MGIALPSVARSLRVVNILACAAGLVGGSLSGPGIAGVVTTLYGQALWLGWLATCGAGSLAAIAGGTRTASRVLVALHYFAGYGYLLIAGVAGPAGSPLWLSSGLALLTTAV